MPVRTPRMTVDRILDWADAHHRRTGRWPTADSGRVVGAGGAHWSAIDTALARGLRGLGGGSSVARLLDKYRRHPNRPQHQLTLQQILEWADENRQRTGRWPSGRSGRVHGAPGERWDRIEGALRRGSRGLRGGTTLARLLTERRRGKTFYTNRPPLGQQEILEWADAHHQRSGQWPTKSSGRVRGATGRTWSSIEKELNRRAAETGGASSLHRLLAERRGKRSSRDLPRLTGKQILTWADRHHRRTGQWPKQTTGPVRGAPGETWLKIDAGLRQGQRGLRGGSSLARLLAKYRGVPNFLEKKPRLTINQIVVWSDRHHRRTGEWPTKHSGPVPRSGGETWIGIDGAIQYGRRGLPGGATLAQVLARRCGRPYRRKATDLTIEQILKWAVAHERRVGRWPSQMSGAVRGAAGERWGNIQSALYTGRRGLPGGSSLAKLLDRHFGT